MSESINVIESRDILELLPHRYPFLLIDRVTNYVIDESLEAIKNVTFNEPCFQGHFPGRPIMPGVLIVEALAQASGILYSKSREPEEGMKFLYFFGGIDKARFKQQVVPGDTLVMKVKPLKVKKFKNLQEIWKMDSRAYVNDELVCSGELISVCRQVPVDE